MARPPSAAAEPQPPVAFTMTLPTGIDPASIGVTVSPDTDAEAVLQDGESIDLLPVTTGLTVGSDRALTVRVDPTSLPAKYVEDSGVSTFEVVALGDGGSSTWTRTVSPQAVMTASGAAWTIPEDVPADTGETSARRRAGGDGLVAVDGPVVPVKAGPLVKLIRSGVAGRQHAGSARASSSTPGGNCMGPRPRQTKVGSAKKVWSTLGTTYPTDGTAATMQVDSSQGATYGIAASGSGEYGSWNASGTRTISGGWGFIWQGSSSSRSYRKEVEYRKYKYEYLDSRCDSYKWLPQIETGGTDEVKGIARPDFWKCEKESVGTWYRDRSDGHAYALGTAVKFSAAIGLDLSISRQYSSSQKTKYFISRAHHYLCGNNNDYPSFSGKLMERVID